MKKFYLGVDIGTDSVGMACTDEEYNLLRAHGQDLWAVRMFDEAQGASKRRTKRTARRRYQRRKQRIEWLQEVFGPYMQDELFFLRLNNSGFWEEDKDKMLQSKYALFADADYTDRDFYRDYPTIFHLRQRLIAGTAGGKDGATDIRLYYLALHHIIKYRGHFRYEGEKLSELRDIKNLFERFNAVAEENYALLLPVGKAEEFYKIALSDMGIREKRKSAEKELNVTSSAMKELLGLLLGAKVKASALFGTENTEYSDLKLCFKGLKDEEFEALQAEYDDDFILLEAAREIYNFFVFEKVLKGHEYISEAMTERHENHKRDLRTLKDFVKTQMPQEVYYKIFRSTKEKANYCNYISYTKSGRKKTNVKVCTHEDFCDFLKKIFTENAASVRNKEALETILSSIEKEDFLPKILNADNGLFPHQVNGAELDCILENLVKEYPAFGEKDGSGFSPADKIRKIFLFKIPYYVGPLNVSHQENGNSWAVRKDGKIYPWTFEDIVDFSKSNERFIRRMTNKCTYLYGKDVLPKCSMYYQAYNVLNQLNKMKIDEQPISVELKQELFSNLFLKKKKVTVKMIRDYLAVTGKYTKTEAAALCITGFDGEIEAKMDAYITLKGCLGKFVDEHPDICENIILLHTLNTDKKLVESVILQKYGEFPEIRENIKTIKGITSFQKFGRFSKELLCEVSGGVNPVTGEIYTILERLYHTNQNFNELLYAEEYSFLDAIERENTGREEQVDYEDVKELYVSPMVRRGIWQTLLMTEEYIKAVGRVPDKIFVEVTRQGAKDKKPTKSRKSPLLELYKGLGKDDGIKELCGNIKELLEELNGKTNLELRREWLYLYFMQLGRCAYSGQRLSLDELGSDLYEKDHILPRSMTKDDSIDNKVLVKRELNAKKSDEYPIPNGFTNQHGFWKLLKKKGLMSDKKYALLTRTNPLTEEDFNNFVNRQLTITNQTAKAVAELLKRKYGASGTKIVYSKAANVSEFRNRYKIIKCRETNDLHHARDAYLNIVVGNVYDTKFSSAKDYFYRKDDGWREYNLKTLFDRPIAGAWNGAETISSVKRTVQKTTMQVTRYAYTYRGEFYKETVYKKSDSGVSTPRKEKGPYLNTERYGGYKFLRTAYFVVVRSKDKKGNVIKTIEAIPVLIEYKTRNDPKRITEYLVSQGLIEPEILIPKIKVKSLLCVNGYRVWIAGIKKKQVELHNAQQWLTDAKTDLYVKNLIKLSEEERIGALSAEEKSNASFIMDTNRKREDKVVIDAEQNIELYRTILHKLQLKCYRGLSSVRSFAEKLAVKESEFCALSVLNQAKVLIQLVRFMKCNAELADLSLLNEGANCGTLLIGKDITKVSCAIIHQSPCGTVTRIQKI